MTVQPAALPLPGWRRSDPREIGIACVVALAAGVILVLGTLPSVVAYRNPMQVVGSSVLCLLHGGLYALGGRLRHFQQEKFYLSAHLALLVAFGLVAPPLAVATFVYLVFVTQATRHLTTWSPARLVMVATLLFGAITVWTDNLVRGIAVALMLAVAGAFTVARRRARRAAAARAEAEDDDEPVAAPGSALTDKELQLLRLAATGATARRIAAKLNTSEHSVETHLLTVYGKLGVEGRAAAVAVATQLGLL